MKSSPSLSSQCTLVMWLPRGETSVSIAKASDGGIYACEYHYVGDRYRWSARSDTVYINITDPSLSKPSIKMKPGKLLALGMNVTIECQGPEADLIYSLHKSQNLAATQVVETAGHPARFPLPLLRVEDAGSYTCQYAHREQPFVWSEASDPAELILKDRFKTILLVCCAGGLLLLVLLLLVAFILYRKKRRSSTANQRSQPLPVNEINMFLEADAEEDPNEISYAELNHHPLKNKQPANPDGVSESCVYASVNKNGTGKGR